MGLLAETKRSSKISDDPNNTKWSRDTNTFGQKILRSQGWQPGEFLGAKDAPHAEFHTAANASFVRVALKDDQKGLGFNRRQEDEVTGLDVFSDLLSRLNGKSEGEIVEAQQARMEVKTNLYVERKWGPMRFVKGGLLVGDDMKDLDDDDTSEYGASNGKKDIVSKKRKAEQLVEEGVAPAQDDEATRSKRRKEDKKKSKKLRKEASGDEPSPAMESDEAKAARRKEKKEKKRLGKEATAQVSEDDSELRTHKKNKKRRTTEQPAEDDISEKMTKLRKDNKDKKKRKDKSGQNPSTEASTPAAAGSGMSTPSGSRNFVRSRFIAQKRQAVLDTKALNQIFMMKA